jgi:CO/xanthine dehydrogenase Mo-binding subunit
LTEDRFTMDFIATETRFAQSNAAHDQLTRTSEVGCARNANVENLNIETATMNPLLPADRKWAIRFNAGGTVTIVLGMRDYGRGLFSGYFARLVAARLGIPFGRVRVYYSATLPAVLQTPQPVDVPSDESTLHPIAKAAAGVIGEMCDRVIEKGRFSFAAMARVGTADVGFDQQTGRLFVLDRDRSGGILEVAETARGESPLSTEFARKLQRDDENAIASDIQVASAA